MKQSSEDMNAKPEIGDARDLLVRLYGNIGIPAVAAAAEMARRPAPEDQKPEVHHDIPAILQDHDLAA